MWSVIAGAASGEHTTASPTGALKVRTMSASDTFPSARMTPNTAGTRSSDSSTEASSESGRTRFRLSAMPPPVMWANAFNPAAGTDIIYAVEVDGSGVYHVGVDTIGGDNRWRLIKRRKSDGSELWSTFSDPTAAGNDVAFDVAIDRTGIYVVGYDSVPGNFQWRIEKRDLETGALITSSGTRGVVQNNVASPGTYFFRMATSDGSPLDEYTNYPEVTAVMPPLTQQDYRWYQNENDVNPNSPLAGENTGFATAAPGALYRIRMNVEVTGVALPLGTLAFKLQYSTGTSGPWTDVGNINSSNLWRGFNNSSPTDGDPLSLRLASSNVGESYEEANPSRVNRNAIAVGSRGEWDWVVQNNSALGDTTYFFRMVQADSTPLNAYTNFPTLSTILPPIASDDFESGGALGGSGWLGPWNFDGDAKIEKKDDPHQGSFHLRLKRTNGHADRSLDLFGKSSVRVQFWAKAEQFKSGDTATLSASTDGITYQTVETWTISDSDGQYHFFDIELPASSFSSTSFIAFDSNMSDNKAKFFIDELIVIGD